MKSFFIVLVLCSMPMVCNSAVIEMHFLDSRGAGGHQSLEFITDITGYGPFGELQFGDVNIYDENKLYELDPLTSRWSHSEYNGSFYFQVQSRFDDPEHSWIHKSSDAVIRSVNISHLGYSNITELTPTLLEEILDSLVGQPEFFSYYFSVSSPSENGLYTSNYDTTLTSWNYKTSSVPIPATVWLFGSGLIGLIGVARRKARTEYVSNSMQFSPVKV